MALASNREEEKEMTIARGPKESNQRSIKGAKQNTRHRDPNNKERNLHGEPKGGNWVCKGRVAK